MRPGEQGAHRARPQPEHAGNFLIAQVLGPQADALDLPWREADFQQSLQQIVDGSAGFGMALLVCIALSLRDRRGQVAVLVDS